MKTAISIPDELFDRADDLAKRTGKSRSELYADALRAHLSRQVDASVTERLNVIYDDHDADADERRWLEVVAENVAERTQW